ncbi:unnamed protein product [Acidocella sp. C78]|uniref:NrsF family protein n=1 Tax=Acidocella sp. C78 TaxID=1671486 RepID=UPI00191BC675|nr:NrsF family protein [Acidocella sp. C78]CAG4913969.1 unnamed protein product [Acidocella sp. C78]
MRSEDLITSLAQDLGAVRPLPSPARLLAVWLGVSVPVLAAITLMMGPRPDLAGKCGEAGFVISQGLGVVTAVVSAYAAFCAGRPDQPGWKLWAPMLAMLVWLGDLGRQCAVVSLQDAGGVLRLQLDPMCVPAIVIAGVIPAGLIVALMRRSATFRRDHACLCGALAAGAAADVALRLFHGSVNIATLLLWQMGSVMLFTSTAWFISSTILRNVARAPRRRQLAG